MATTKKLSDNIKRHVFGLLRCVGAFGLLCFHRISGFKKLLIRHARKGINKPTAAIESNLLRVSIPQEPIQRNYDRPPPLKEACLVCFEGSSTPPTPCCHKPLCNKCLNSWLSQRRVTCLHCRERLPNEMILRNQEASDALLSDPGFQRRIRAVSLSFRCLFLTILRDKKYFFLANAEFQFILPPRNPSNTMSCVRCHRKQSTAT